VSARAAADPAIVKTIEDALHRPVFFRDIVDATKQHPYRMVLQAWSDIRSRLKLERDELGRYWVATTRPPRAG
jgi:hypothetical protein